jgi:hypothetical protein
MRTNPKNGVLVGAVAAVAALTALRLCSWIVFVAVRRAQESSPTHRTGILQNK